MVLNTLLLNQITKDVIKEFADDGVKYLELRSTPREENSTGTVSSGFSFVIFLHYRT